MPLANIGGVMCSCLEIQRGKNCENKKSELQKMKQWFKENKNQAARLYL